MKRYLKLFMFFLISILICLLFFNYLPKVKNYFWESTQKNTALENEILLKKYVENDMITMLYLYESTNANDLETDAFHNTMITVSKSFPDTIRNKIVDINSETGKDVQKYINQTSDKSFAVLIDKNGYVLGVYKQPINQKNILTELTYASTYAN